MNYPIQQSKPQYYPKIDSYTNEARDLDLSELRRKYPIGFKCCDNNYLPEKFSQFRAQHIKTCKHIRKVISPATQEFKENLGDSDSLLEAFEKKCRENRELKKLNLQKQLEIDKEKLDKDRILQRNIDLQEEIKELKTKNKQVKLKIREENLIDLLN
jgi:hypothetical protein